MSPDRDTPPAAPPPGSDPPWLRTIRQLREAFDLIFPALVAVALAGVALLLFVRPELRGDAAALTGLGTILLALAGLGFRTRKGPP